VMGYDFDGDDFACVQVAGQFDLTVRAETDCDVRVLVAFEELVAAF
jgi:hypothetical protein